MAIIPESQYPGKITPASTEYPYGQARNITLPGDGTGTPWEAALVNDIFGFQQAILSGADIVPSGDPEKVGTSQYLDALRNLLGAAEANTADMVARDYKIGVLVFTQGDTAAGDGGRTAWRIVAGGTGTADGVNYVDLDNGNQAENVRLSSENLLHAGGLLSTVIDGLLEDSAQSGSVTASWSLSKVNVEKAVSPWGMKAPINNLGDSISHGAFAGELYYNGWTRILARMLSGDYGGLSYQGFVPMTTLGSGATESRDIHSIAFVGTWNAQSSESSVNGAASYNGLSFQTLTQGNRITSQIPTFQKQALVWYLQQPGGGELTVSDNTGALNVIDTNGTLSVKVALVALVDNGQGSTTLQAEKTDANGTPVDVLGFGYIQGVNTPVLHNFSTSGRRLRYVDEQVIDDCASNSAVFMLSLGHNDRGDVDADPGGAYATAFTQRIDWVIQYCNANNTFLVVNDFCWTAADTSFTRSELKRAAVETGGLYIPFPNLIKPDGSVPGTTYLTSTLNMWVDGSHPNAEGNKWIAETIAKYIGLSVTSKADAVAKYDYWMPFELPAGTSNSFTSPGSVSAYRIDGGQISYRWSVQRAAGGSFPTGTFQLQTGFRVPLPDVQTVGTPTTAIGYIRTDTNALTSSADVSLGGNVTLYVTDGTWVNDQKGTAKLDIEPV